MTFLNKRNVFFGSCLYCSSEEASWQFTQFKETVTRPLHQEGKLKKDHL